MAHGETYEEFTKKFEPKKTTDDCYTPPHVYDEIKAWVNDELIPLDGVNVMRPFRPGGDYQSEEYPEGCLVLDNPPFSILASIVDWYNARGVRFFLFAPHLTLFNYCNRDGVTAIVADARIVYANGAKVKTSFVTNCYPGAPSFVVAGDLCLRVQEADRLARNEQRPLPKPQLEYPPQLVNAAILGKLCQRGIRLSAPRGETHFIRRLDSGRSIFGAGFLLSDRMARERTQAEKRARQHQLAGTVENYTPHEEELLPGPEMVTLALSDREREIIASLSGE